MEVPREFFTPQSMLTLAGATGATVVIANGIQSVSGKSPKWLALLIAIVIVEFGVFKSGGVGSDYFIGAVNGFLVYCSAAGATQIGSGATSSPLPRGQAPAEATRRRFWSGWF